MWPCQRPDIGAAVARRSCVIHLDGMQGGSNQAEKPLAWESDVLECLLASKKLLQNGMVGPPLPSAFQNSCLQGRREGEGQANFEEEGRRHIAIRGDT